MSEVRKEHRKNDVNIGGVLEKPVSEREKEACMMS